MFVDDTLHYTRDVTFQEDHSRIRHKPGVLAALLRLQHTASQSVLNIQDMLPLSPEPMRSSSGTVESIEQPWAEVRSGVVDGL